MATDTASNANNSTKRARIDPSAADPSTEKASRPVPPKTIAQRFAAGHVATLHPQVATILLPLFEDFISTKMKIFTKDTQLKKMEADDEFIPRSARIDFRFHLSAEAKLSVDYSTLVDQTNEEIKAFTSILKQRIIQAMKLELAALHKKLQKLIAKAIRYTAQAFLIIQHPNADTLPTDTTARESISDLADDFLKTTGFADANTLITIYNEQHETSIDAIPPPQAPQDNSDSIVLNDVNLMAQHNVPQAPTTSATARNIIATLTALFSTSWAQFMAQHNQNQLRIRLARFSVEALDAPATDDTAMVTNDEPNVEPAVVGDMIHAEVLKQNKHLSATITKLTTRLDSLAKNSIRRSTASSTQQKKRRPTKNRKEPAQAGEPANATVAAKPNRRSKGTKKKQGTPSGRSRSRSPRRNNTRGRK
jgi:hypothetical protein